MNELIAIRKLFLTGIIFAILTVSASATIILVVRTADVILLAADSKATYYGTGTPGPSVVCKIFPIHSGFVAISGLARSLKGGGFDPKLIAENAFQTKKPFAEHVRTAERMVIENSRDLLHYLRLQEPDAYAQAMKGDGFLSMLFVTFEDKTPLIAGRQFRYDENRGESEIIKAFDCPGKDCPGSRGLYFGYMGNISSLSEDMKYQLLHTVDAQLLRTAIQKQIEATPETVGGPITILQIDDNGPHWISDDAGCPVR